MYTIAMEFVGDAHIAAGREEDIPLVLQLLRDGGIATDRNPDLYVKSLRAFGIDDARELSERAAARAFSGRRVFVISTDSISSEAQNALLKTLEEPSAGALFIFLVPSPLQLLPTVRSRVQFLNLRNEKNEISKGATAFLEATPAKRLELLKTLLEKNDDDKRDVGAILEFLASLERALCTRVQDARAREGLRAIYRARSLVGDRGALVKPLLEQLALLL